MDRDNNFDSTDQVDSRGSYGYEPPIKNVGNGATACIVDQDPHPDHRSGKYYIHHGETVSQGKGCGAGTAKPLISDSPSH